MNSSKLCLEFLPYPLLGWQTEQEARERTAPGVPSPNELAARHGRLLRENGLKCQPRTGLVYPTSHGEGLYDWELYFDCLALLYYGLHQPAIGGLRMFLQTQHADGFICRRVLRDAPQSGWGLLEAEEHCKPFLCQIARKFRGHNHVHLIAVPRAEESLRRAIGAYICVTREGSIFARSGEATFGRAGSLRS